MGAQIRWKHLREWLSVGNKSGGTINNGWRWRCVQTVHSEQIDRNNVLGSGTDLSEGYRPFKREREKEVRIFYRARWARSWSTRSKSRRRSSQGWVFATLNENIPSIVHRHEAPRNNIASRHNGFDVGLDVDKPVRRGPESQPVGNGVQGRVQV